jgi:predicted Zn-dependent protease
MHRYIRMLAALAFALLASGCATSTAPGVFGVTRTQLLIVPSAEINAQAAEGYMKLSNFASQAGRLNTDAALTARVKGVAARLIHEVPVFRPDAAGWQWDVSVFESDEINAFCMPGGKIGIYSGLVKKLALSDDEIAVVMGHEISHALREHSREKASQSRLSKAIVQAIASSNSRYASTNASLANLGSQLFVQLPFSREMELEADLMGLELLARAGYDPRLAPGFWRKFMQATGQPGQAEFLNTHPNDDRRIAQAEASIPKVLSVYEAAVARRAGSTVMTASASGRATSATPTTTVPAIAETPQTPSASLTSSLVASKSSRVPARIGEESYQVERMPEAKTCNAAPVAKLTAKGPGFETYVVSCSNGDALSIRCEFGNCRTLQ